MIYLLDKSATAARHGPVGRRRLEHLITTGRLAMCEMTALEILYSARNGNDYEDTLASLNAYRWLSTTTAAMQRALEVQRMLAAKGQHRCPLPDLIIAATAETHGATVLHTDHDFEIIAGITHQPMESLISA